MRPQGDHQEQGETEPDEEDAHDSEDHCYRVKEEQERKPSGTSSGISSNDDGVQPDQQMGSH